MKHKDDCRMAFGRKDKTCPRCQELLNGAKPKASWHKGYYQSQAAHLAAIRSHDCKKSRCMVVCTAFDY